MSAPNLSTLWANNLVGELVASGLAQFVIAPGSRSTPLTVAAAGADGAEIDTHLDERSAGFYALGYGKQSGEPGVLVSTSGTGAVNFHPAVVEAHHSRTPLVVLTADRPPELQDSGANQTIDQHDLYGDAPRFARTLPTPDARPRTRRSLRTTVARAVRAAKPPNAGPVHLNVPLRKPLAPVEEPTEQAAIEQWADTGSQEGTAVKTHRGTVRPAPAAISDLTEAIENASRGLLVAGPLAPDPDRQAAIAKLGTQTGFPLLADPLSNMRFGDHLAEAQVFGGYDGYLGTTATASWPDPDVVVRFGASPTSKPLRQYLRDSATRQFLIDPAGGWQEATFTATDHVHSAVRPLVESLDPIDAAPSTAWKERFDRAETVHWQAVNTAEYRPSEGTVLGQVTREAPDPATIFVSNSMAVRDLDRFGQPQEAALTVLGNRGASGIDGILSTALGAGKATPDPLIAVTGDLAYFHDMNGLIALGRFGLDATIVLVNNDGGAIFHMLPIADFDPPFESQFKTPHNLDFSATEALYDLEFDTIKPETVGEAVAKSANSPGTQVLEVRTDAERSHEIRNSIRETVEDRLNE
ncbi:2-succinyl-5-enolpyruvyl-6-hydroxy-3-cyclohexene-1-carboxylic-acid synthase [Halodesulfurarchaeum sp.]|uniref:2-succinyl-5-enolpyruvyl-6-hydroxy-3- cyclohexene-1-carboxylic-acid synthase n=1 Tax=Halodesulfurarchaeum sp. TaxID=1980530 RepID=UPI001BB87AC6|nr:2-succinyl-5-enolpyruvyl-6-hydroxy-3-cyclohexene-1-carboxylic-acid synthase [Halodesulfurarchaeum sp.]